jgi:hypothetical protein
MPSKEGGGKWTEWHNAEWHRRTGLRRSHLGRIRDNLLRRKIILKNKGKLAFNKHFDKWAKDSYMSTPSAGPIRPVQVRPGQGLKYAQDRAQSTPSAGSIKPHRAKSSAEVQSLKKERKKETIKTDKDFDKFWGKYPKKRQKIPARKAWDNHYTKHGRFTLDLILSTLEAYIKDDWQGREMQFIPHAASWLNKHPWEDFKGEEKPEWKKELERRLTNLHSRWSGDMDMDRLEYEELRQQIINEYKEKK